MTEQKYPIRLSVTYRPGELGQGFWMVLRETRLPGIVLASCFGAFSIYNLLLVRFYGGATKSDSLILILLLLCGVLISLVVAAGVYFYHRDRCLQRHDNLSLILLPRIFTFDLQSFEVQYPGGGGFIDWPIVKRIIESGSLICLQVRTGEIFVLPKRCFADKQQMRDFIEMCRQKVKPSDYIISGSLKESVDFTGTTLSTQSPANSLLDLTAATNLIRNQFKFESEKILQFAYLPLELKNAEKIFFFRKRLSTLILLWLNQVLIVSVLCIIYRYFAPSYIGLAANNLMQCCIAVAVPGLIVHAGFIYYKTVVLAGTEPGFATNMEAGLSQNGIEMRYDERKASLAWAYFLECWETEDQYILLFGPGGRAMFVLPKRILQTASDKAYVEQLLATKIDRYKKLF